MRFTSFFPNVVSGILLLCFTLLILLDIKSFSLWEQITDLSGVSPLYLLEIFSPHALRYLVMYPVIFLAKITMVDVDTVFSFYVIVIAYVMSVIMGNTIKYLLPNNSTNPSWYRVLFLTCWLPILLFMNGRLIFAFFGMSVIIYSQVAILAKYEKKKNSISLFLILQVVGLLFASVSTGTFSVAFCVVEMFFIALTIRKYVKEQIIMRIIIVSNFIILLIFVPFEAQFITKNIRFFNNTLPVNFQNNASSKKIATLEIVKKENAPIVESVTAIEVAPKLLAHKEVLSAEIATKEDNIKVEGSPLEKAINHGVLHFLVSTGVDMTVIKILFYSIFIVGFLTTIVSYFQKSLNVVTLTPIIASIGVSMSIGLFGISTFLLMLPSIFLLFFVRCVGGR